MGRIGGRDNNSIYELGLVENIRYTRGIMAIKGNSTGFTATADRALQVEIAPSWYHMSFAN